MLTKVKRILTGAVLIVFMTAPGAQSKASTTVDMAGFRKDLAELQTQVSETTSSLEEVKKAAKEGTDLAAPYTGFAAKLKQLQSNFDTVRAKGTQIRARAEDHYKAWQTELSKMGNPKLREKAMNRFGDAKEEFDQIIVVAEQVKREIGPFMADLNDVATYFKSDLSPSAVKSLAIPIWALGNKSRAVVGSLQHLNAQINRALEQLPAEK